MKRSKKVLWQLQCRLTLLFSVMAGIILCTALYLAWTAACDQLKQKQMKEYEDFVEHTETIVSTTICGNGEQGQKLELFMRGKTEGKGISVICTVYFDGAVLATAGEKNLKTPFEKLRKKSLYLFPTIKKWGWLQEKKTKHINILAVL